jgi:hypothetical protein
VIVTKGPQFRDTSGNTLHVHGGGALKVGAYYWFGRTATPTTPFSQSRSTGPRASRPGSSVAGRAGGPARRSAESPVMGAEQRGRIIRGWSVSSTGYITGRNYVGELKAPGKPIFPSGRHGKPIGK